jgi:hypothetical protein
MSGRRGKKKRGTTRPVSVQSRLGSAASESPPAPGSVLPGERPASRSEERLRRKQASRRRMLWLVSVPVVLALVAGGVWLWVSRDTAPAPVDAAPVRTERTVAFVVAKEGEPVEAGALLVADPEAASGSELLVQSRLFVDGVTSSAVPFEDTAVVGGLGTPGDALATTLAVVVDGTWRLTPKGLAALVDAVGPITVDVDVEVLAPAAGGGRTVVLVAGNGQQVDGAQAAAFATYRAPGEPEEARLARFSEVTTELFAKLPADPTGVAAALDALGTQSRSTLDTGELAAVLVSLGDVVRADDARLQALPVVPIETGGPREALALDETEFDSIRSTALAGSLPPVGPEGPLRVLVENGVCVPGIDRGAARLIRNAGYVFINGGNANACDYDKSVVIIADGSPEEVARGEAVADAMGLPRSSIRRAATGQQVADVIVIMGADFDPQFQPDQP